jgi:hypothetical protein
LVVRGVVGPRRFAVLGLEALEPRELLSLTPGQKAVVVDAIPLAVISPLAKAVVPAVIVSPAPNFVDAAEGRIPIPNGPHAANVALAANANLAQRPLLADALGLGAGSGSSGDIRPRSAVNVAIPPNALLPQGTLPPPPGQGTPPTPPTPPAPPPKPRVGFGSQASNNASANSQTGASSGSARYRIARERAVLDFGGPDAGGTPAGQGEVAGDNTEAHDQALLAMFSQKDLPFAPVAPSAYPKPAAEGTLAKRPGTVR